MPNDLHHQWRHRVCRDSAAALLAIWCMFLCTPGMGVILWGESPLYVNLGTVEKTEPQILAEGKGGTARDRPKEAGAQSYEPTNRNGIQGPVSG